jgi:hypothetical protein
MDQDIRFCTASDNTHLTYARVGHGPPLVKVGNWLSHLEDGWNSPVWRTVRVFTHFIDMNHAVVGSPTEAFPTSRSMSRRMPSRRHSSAIFSSPRSPSSTIRTFSYAEYFLRVFRQISRTAASTEVVSSAISAPSINGFNQILAGKLILGFCRKYLIGCEPEQPDYVPATIPN